MQTVSVAWGFGKARDKKMVTSSEDATVKI
jgi:hypothetical protein